MNYQEKSELLKALGHPVRLRMVEGLMRNECNVKKIVQALGLPQSTVSQHLSILKSQGIVEARKEGVKTCYYVADKKVREMIRLLRN